MIKASVILAVLSSLSLTSAFAVQEIKTPRAYSPAVSTETEPLHALLTSLVEEYEGLKVGQDDLEVYMDDPEEGVSPCRQTSPELLECEVAYLQDRWNGVMTVSFKTERGQIVELTSAAFDGNF